MRRRKAVAVTTIVMGIFALTFLAGASPGWAKGTSGPSAVPFKDIASSGPLTHVYLGNELSCQVAHTGDTDLELYPPDTIPGDCGTLLVDTRADRLYAPDFDAHGTTATGSLGSYTVFTPVSQTPVTGSGTNQDPYKVVTVANAGSSGLVLTETDTYVVGQESYTTSVSVDNTGETSLKPDHLPGRRLLPGRLRRGDRRGFGFLHRLRPGGDRTDRGVGPDHQRQQLLREQLRRGLGQDRLAPGLQQHVRVHAGRQRRRPELDLLAERGADEDLLPHHHVLPHRQPAAYDPEDRR